MAAGVVPSKREQRGAGFARKWYALFQGSAHIPWQQRPQGKGGEHCVGLSSLSDEVSAAVLGFSMPGLFGGVMGVLFGPSYPYRHEVDQDPGRH